MPKVFLSAGEASGEHYGVLLMEALRRMDPGIEFFGMGGRRMEALGCRRIVRAEDVAVMGITEVVRHMPRIYGEYRRLKQSLRDERPEAAILIDFPDVNLRLARELHRLGVPVIFFVSPQLWAWKKRRIRWVERYVDRMLVIFPFEEPFYREHGVAADFVGHPLADVPPPAVSRQDFADQYRLDPSKDWIGLLPGSRAKEVRLNLPEMVKSATLLNRDYEFLLPLAPTLTENQVAGIRRLLAELLPAANPPKITLVRDARATLQHARASVVASGTATVEAALIGNPFVVVYRVSAVTYAVAQRVVKVPFVAMVNLVAGRAVVPELIQGNFTAAQVVSHLQPLLGEGSARQTMLESLREVALRLRSRSGHGTAIERAASITMQLIAESVHRIIEPSLAE